MSILRKIGNRLRRLQMTVLRDSTFRSRSDLPGCSLQPTALVDALVETIKPRTALDVGCGTGKALDYFLAKGVDCFGVEGSTMAVGHAVHPERITVWNLNKPYQAGRLFDLVWCFEVAEHIHPSYVSSFLDTLCSHAPHILLSAAHPGQGGVGHFNEQPPSYWIRKLAERGFDYDDALTKRITMNWQWYPENVMFFRKPV
jgi:2-polyprenyl-3-methyl-5-hydroxy-6-metoxy-1,4-benzoquinol methylase